MSGKIEVRPGMLSDEEPLIRWLLDEGVLRWFPMYSKVEVLDAARIWISYVQKNAVLTATIDGKPCGITNLYVQPYKKLAHQCLFAIIVAPENRGQGIGTILLTELFKLAKEIFKIEILHLEVYDGNPAMKLYERLGFKTYGFQKHFVKEPNGEYRGKYFMQKRL